jgi:hypothetical protein
MAFAKNQPDESSNEGKLIRNLFGAAEKKGVFTGGAAALFYLRKESRK